MPVQVRILLSQPARPIEFTGFRQTRFKLTHRAFPAALRHRLLRTVPERAGRRGSCAPPAGVLDQHRRRQAGRLSPRENGGGDIGGTVGEAENGQAENLIKGHKLHLASDRTSCTKASANQFRLLIHTAVYWLMLSLRGPAPRTSFWRDAQFDTIRLCLIEVAARVTEMVTRIKPLPGRLRRTRRTHRQAAANAHGAVAPDKPSSPISNRNHPRHRRHEKPRHRAAVSQNPIYLMNNPG
jgi:hypothetical protein